MYWWNLRAAKRDLAAQAPGARGLLPYLLGFAVVESVTTELSFLTPSQEDPASARVWLTAFAGAAITVLGCVYAYFRNGGATGTQFLERLLVLGWVAGVRYTACVVLGTVLFFGLVVALYPQIGDAAMEWADVLYLAAALAFYLYLGRQVGGLARASNSYGR
jgi:hypothetical protein